MSMKHKLVIAAMLLILTGTTAYASFSAISLGTGLPAEETAHLSDDLQLLEAVAGNWTPEWRHELPKEEAILKAEQTLRKIDELLFLKQAPSGELLLLKGLAAHYAYNLDLQKSFDVAVESLQKARNALPADCRPLWFLGNHYCKAGEAGNGIALLQQAAADCRDTLPLSFWEDYAYAAVLAAMPSTADYALDQVRQKNAGVLTAKVRAVEAGVRKTLVAPVQGKEYKPEEIWRYGEKSGMMRFVNGMYGFMVEVPGNWGVSPFGVRENWSGIGIQLPKKAKWPPPLHAVLIVAPAASKAAPKEVLREFVAKAGPARKFTSIPGPGIPAGENFIWIESRQKKGSRILAGIFRRPQPAYPGLLLESPHDFPEAEGAQAPSYYTPVQQLTRVRGDLDYLIMIEGAPAVFEKSRADLELLLRNLVVE